MAEDVVTRAEVAYAGLTKGEWKVSPPLSKTFPGNYWSIGTATDGLVERFTGECANSEGDAQFFVKSTVLVPELVAEVMQLREQLIDAAVQYLDQSAAYYRDAIKGPANEIHKHLDLTVSELTEYVLDPREFVWQKLFGSET